MLRKTILHVAKRPVKAQFQTAFYIQPSLHIKFNIGQIRIASVSTNSTLDSTKTPISKLPSAPPISDTIKQEAIAPTSTLNSSKSTIETNSDATITSSTTKSSVADKTKSVPIIERIAKQLNICISQYPAETIAVLFASDIASIGATYGLITATGIQISPEFALAFALSRAVRRIRIPLDIGFAAILSKALPALATIKVSHLGQTFITRNNPADSVALTSPSFLQKAITAGANTLDKYGAAYLLGSRLCGITVVCGIYALLQQGIDVMPYLERFGIGNVGTALGSYAGAVVFASALYPVTLGVAGYIIPPIAKIRKTVLP